MDCRLSKPAGRIGGEVSIKKCCENPPIIIVIQVAEALFHARSWEGVISWGEAYERVIVGPDLGFCYNHLLPMVIENPEREG